jgi:hypothetical protein
VLSYWREQAAISKCVIVLERAGSNLQLCYRIGESRQLFPNVLSYWREQVAISKCVIVFERIDSYLQMCYRIGESRQLSRNVLLYWREQVAISKCVIVLARAGSCLQMRYHAPPIKDSTVACKITYAGSLLSDSELCNLTPLPWQRTFQCSGQDTALLS